MSCVTDAAHGPGEQISSLRRPACGPPTSNRRRRAGDRPRSRSPSRRGRRSRSARQPDRERHRSRRRPASGRLAAGDARVLVSSRSGRRRADWIMAITWRYRKTPRRSGNYIVKCDRSLLPNRSARQAAATSRMSPSFARGPHADQPRQQRIDADVVEGRQRHAAAGRPGRWRRTSPPSRGWRDRSRARRRSGSLGLKSRVVRPAGLGQADDTAATRGLLAVVEARRDLRLAPALEVRVGRQQGGGHLGLAAGGRVDAS